MQSADVLLSNDLVCAERECMLGWMNQKAKEVGREWEMEITRRLPLVPDRYVALSPLLVISTVEECPIRACNLLRGYQYSR